MTVSSSTGQVLPQLGVSNSEAADAGTCMRRWWFAHHPQVHLAPQTLGPALTRGIVGHKALELFYVDLKKGVDYDEAAQNSLNYIFQQSTAAMMANDGDKLEILVYLKKLLEKYFVHYQDDIKYWEILDVESFHLLEWDGEKTVYLPMKLDLVIYMTDGQFRGETCPVDHKFVNDFWQQWKFRLNSQLPLYMRALRASRFAGKPAPVVRRSIVNQIRTRKVETIYPVQTFRRSFIEADDDVMENVFANHLKIARKVAALKNLPAGEAFQQTEAVWGSPNCQFCHFKSLCSTQLENGNVDMTVAAEYKKSDYGYPAKEELQRER